MSGYQGYRPIERDDTKPDDAGTSMANAIDKVARFAKLCMDSRDEEIAALKQAVATLGHEVYGLRGVQRELCDTCEANGLGKRGRCYGLRMATDANALACAAVKPAPEVGG